MKNSNGTPGVSHTHTQRVFKTQPTRASVTFHIANALFVCLLYSLSPLRTKLRRNLIQPASKPFPQWQPPQTSAPATTATAWRASSTAAAWRARATSTAAGRSSRCSVTAATASPTPSSLGPLPSFGPSSANNPTLVASVSASPFALILPKRYVRVSVRMGSRVTWEWLWIWGSIVCCVSCSKN